MKRSRFIFFCVGTLILLFLCACNDVVELENVDSSGADKEVIENVNREDSNANIVWENSELDMDGNGIADYACIEIMKEENVDYWNVVTVVLDDGSSSQIKYAGRTKSDADYIYAGIGRLHFDSRDSIAVQIQDSMSNYCSADIHVLSVSENGQSKDLTEELTILDGSKKSALYDTYQNSVFLLDDAAITITAEKELVTYNEELKRNVVQITEYIDGECRELLLYWNGNAWDKLSINNTQVSQHVSNDLYNEVAEQIGEDKATQIRVMAENSDQWKLQDYAPTKGLYMAYDLDGDGRLELIANAVQGTGAYSHNYFYQVNPENTAVVELEQVLEDEKPLCFDIGLDWEQKVYVDENGTHYYYAIDYEGSGTWQTICKEGYFYLSEGKVGRIMLRESVNQLQEDGTYEKTYYTPDGIYEKTYDTPDSSESISEEEWHNLLHTFAEGKEETSVNIEWVSLYEEEGEAMSADEWFVLLADSYLKSSSL